MSAPCKGTVIDCRDGMAFLRVASKEEQIQQSIRACLLTRVGERSLAPRFGSLLHRFVFRPFNTSLVEDLQKHIKEVLREGEPRVRVLEVRVRPGEIDIQFENKTSREKGEVKVGFHA